MFKDRFPEFDYSDETIEDALVAGCLWGLGVSVTLVAFVVSYVVL